MGEGPESSQRKPVDIELIFHKVASKKATAG